MDFLFYGGVCHKLFGLFFNFAIVMSLCDFHLSERMRCMRKVCVSFVLGQGGEGLVFKKDILGLYVGFEYI